VGAWGFDVFENDTACDYAAEVAEGSDLSGIEGKLDHILRIGTAYLKHRMLKRRWLLLTSLRDCKVDSDNKMPTLTESTDGLKTSR
jgi:hypothetical protein